jgi:hypothetical protein
MLMGMGQNCPSLQQLQGDIDCSDPCQSSGAICTGTATPAPPPATPCPAGSTCSIVPGIPNTNIYLGIGAVVSVFFLVTMFGGGHR